MDLLGRIERHLRATRIPPSRFGRDAMGDPQFVFDLRDGRVLQRRTAGKVAAYLDRVEAEQRVAVAVAATQPQDARPC